MVRGGQARHAGRLVSAGGGRWCGADLLYLHPHYVRVYIDFGRNSVSERTLRRLYRRHGGPMTVYGAWGARKTRWEACVSRLGSHGIDLTHPNALLSAQVLGVIRPCIPLISD